MSGGRRRPRIPIAAKILAIAASMLVFLLVVVFFSNRGIRRVNDQLVDLSQILIPVNELVTAVDVETLEQEIHLGRLVRLGRQEPRRESLIAREKALFEERGARVDEHLAQAVELTRNAAQSAREAANRQRFARLEPLLAEIEAQHQELHDVAAEIIELTEEGRHGELRALVPQLDREGADVERASAVVARELQTLTAGAAATGSADQSRLLRLTAALAGSATLLGLCYAFLVTRGLVRPLRRLLRAAAGVEAGRQDVEVAVTTRDELGALSRAFNEMVAELRHKEEIKDTFGKYIDRRVVDRLLEDPDGAPTGGEKRLMTVCFCDLHGFAAAIDDLSPGQRVAITNRYLTLLSAPVSEHLGILDKYIGTTVMSFWGPPFVGEDEHARLACLAALDQAASVAEIERLVREATDGGTSGTARQRAALGLHAGLATGPLVVGSMGSEAAKSFTVLGDTVNMASRLKGAAEQYGTRVMMSEETQAAAADAVEAREIDLLRVVGKDEPLRVFEPLGLTGELDAATIERRDAYRAGLDAYRGRQWDEAKACFSTCLRIDAADGPASLFLRRLRELAEAPPAADWDSVWQLTKK